MVLLFALTEIGFRLFFAQPGLALRNEGFDTQSMDYLFEQLERSTAKNKVAWIGASVMQGVKNCPPDKTYPVLASRFLDSRGFDVFGVNLAVAYTHMGDFYLLLNESLRRGAKVIPVALHYKTFSGMERGAKQVLYTDLASYLRGQPEADDIRKHLLKLRKSEMRTIMRDRSVARFSALYRYHGMVFPMLTGLDRPPMEILRHQFQLKSGQAPDFMALAADMDYEDRNADHLWRNTDIRFVQANRKLYNKVNLVWTNPAWSLLDQMCKEAGEQSAVLLFFFAPVNKIALDKFRMIDWAIFDQFTAHTRKRIEGSGYPHRVIDLTHSVQAAYFTDFEHMNMNGHKQLARALVPHIRTAIQETPGANP